MNFHDAWRDGHWEPDPLILDDQALVAHVSGLGLVVLTGCGHGGAINIARHAMRLTGVDRLHGLLGGFHLTGPGFEPIIEPTVEALVELSPGLARGRGLRGDRAPPAVGTARRQRADHR